MILKFHVTRSVPALAPGDTVILYAKVLDNDLVREELTVEFFSKTDQYAAVIGYHHADRTEFDTMYTPEEDDNV